MKRTLTILLAVVIIGFAVYLGVCAHYGMGFWATAAPATQRADTWATPLTKPGLENFHRVSDNLYRGAQPDADGFRQLKAMGVKTVVNLRSFSSDRGKIGDTGLGYEHIYMKAWHPETKEVVRFLQIVGDPARRPVFVHCKHGSDRTGTLCAVYRIFIQGWSKEDAIEEMTRGGYGFHRTFDGLPEFLRDLDVDDIRQRAGLTPQPASGASAN